MLRKSKWLLVLVLLLFPVYAVADTSDENEENTKVSELEDKRSSDILKYQANQYAQPEINREPIEGAVLLDSYDLMAENDKLALYVEEESLALQIENKENGFVWMSGLDPNKNYNLNDTWMNMAQSAVTIDFINEDGKIASESILTNQSEVTMEEIDKGFSAEITFEESGIKIPLVVQLNDGSIEVSVPHQEIIEQEKKLATMRIYPFLGAVEGVDHNGYLFIPDGSGALMRFSEKQLASSSPYQASIYGVDEGFTNSNRETEQEEVRIKPAQNVTIPVYGLAHQVNKNALVTVIEGGQTYADILAYPSGVATDFHWITTQYNYRYQYYQPTSQTMDGYNVYQDEMNAFDIKESITFLQEEQANYVGMAHTYQQYLLDNDLLSQKEDTSDIRLEFLGGEVKSGFIWDSVYPMTPINDLPDYAARLQELGVEDMHLVYRGWSEGGLTGTLPNKFPYESELGDPEEFHNVNQSLKAQNIPLYFYTDYTKAYEDAKGFSGRTDIARKINAQPIMGEEEINYYYLSPEKSAEILESDRVEYQAQEMDHLAVDSTASKLFSDFNNEKRRPEVINVYQHMFDNLKKTVDTLSFYQPNDYMFSLTDRYLDIPMYSSNYQFVTDTVPFLQIVLKGYIPYYAPFSNFHENPVDEKLRMIEYGAYPSFYLTSEPSHELINTPSSNLYTSQYDDWESEIIDQYETIESTLGKVEGEAIVSHQVHETGVVEVEYTNGIAIFVNYTNSEKHVDGITIKPKGYLTIDRGDPS